MGSHVRVAAAAVVVCYLALAVGSLLFLGLNREGVLGAAGMLIPAAVASALAAIGDNRAARAPTKVE